MNSKKNMVMILLLVSLSCSEQLWGMKRYKEKREGQPVMNKLKDTLTVYDASRKSELILFKESQKTLSPGVYYRTRSGLVRMPADIKSKDGLSMVNNHISQLVLTNTVLKKMYMPTDNGTHSFSPLTERMCADWARVVVHNDMNDIDAIKRHDKRFDLYITIPGVINRIGYTVDGKRVIADQTKGVLELKVRKTLYEESGICYHRYFSHKGVVGADSFGTRIRTKKENK